MFPALTTDRYLLRNILPSDHQRVFEALSHPDVIKYYGVSYTTLEATQTQMNWYAHLQEKESGIWWAICDKKDPSQLIGACGFSSWNKDHNRIDTGYWLLPAYWKKGIMQECFPEIIAYAFKVMNVHRIEAQVEPGNSNSTSLLKKLGFVYEGTLRDCEIKNGKYISLEYYGLLNAD